MDKKDVERTLEEIRSECAYALDSLLLDNDKAAAARNIRHVYFLASCYLQAEEHEDATRNSNKHDDVDTERDTSIPSPHNSDRSSVSSGRGGQWPKAFNSAGK